MVSMLRYVRETRCRATIVAVTVIAFSVSDSSVLGDDVLPVPATDIADRSLAEVSTDPARDAAGSEDRQVPARDAEVRVERAVAGAGHRTHGQDVVAACRRSLGECRTPVTS